MRPRYTTQTSLRITDDLKENLEAVCDAWKLNPSDYIRAVVSHNVQSDLKQINNSDEKVVFV